MIWTKISYWRVIIAQSLVLTRPGLKTTHTMVQANLLIWFRLISIQIPVSSGRHGCRCWWGWQTQLAGFCLCLPRQPPNWRGRRRTGQWWPVLSGHWALCSAPWSPITTGRGTLREAHKVWEGEKRKMCQSSKQILENNFKYNVALINVIFERH